MMAATKQGHQAGKRIEGYEDVHGGNGIGERNMEGKMLLQYSDAKELCVANAWLRKGEKRKVTYSAGGSESEIDFVLVVNGNRKYLRDMKVIPGDLQHRLVVMDLVVYVNPKQCRSQISSSLSFFIVVDRPIQRSTSGILSLYLCNSK